MQDRPTQDELLDALERFLEDQVVPRTSGALSFNGRVAANVIRMLRRELDNEGAALDREWTGLDGLLGASERPEALNDLRRALSARSEALCERIRSADADVSPYRDEVIAHVRQTVRDKLTVTNPAWLEQ